ncbi:MAG: 50S ribosomal protein L24e [Candidatus ainarchaeum sp.]|nr:50S ribosomal protein L24e [Candidatus ainarchaeum sp.]
MVKCSFCGKEIREGTGKLYAKKDGSISYFCSNKCEKNLIFLKRKPIKTKWTNAYNKMKKTLLTSTKSTEK